MKNDRYGNQLILGITEVQWPAVLLLGACAIPSWEPWLIAASFAFWYFVAYVSRLSYDR